MAYQFSNPILRREVGPTLLIYSAGPPNLTHLHLENVSAGDVQNGNPAGLAELAELAALHGLKRLHLSHCDILVVQVRLLA